MTQMTAYTAPGIKRHKKKETMELFIKDASEFLEVTVEHLKSKDRKHSIVRARHMIMSMLRTKNYSFKEISEYLGGRDHTTALHAIKSVKNQCETDESYMYQYKALCSYINRGF